MQIIYTTQTCTTSHLRMCTNIMHRYNTNKLTITLLNVEPFVFKFKRFHRKIKFIVDNSNNFYDSYFFLKFYFCKKFHLYLFYNIFDHCPLKQSNCPPVGRTPHVGKHWSNWYWRASYDLCVTEIRCTASLLLLIIMSRRLHSSYRKWNYKESL